MEDGMTPAQVKLVQDSFKKIVPIADLAADFFYARLFVLAPEVRGLFPQDLSGQKKKLMQMLTAAIANLHQMEKILPAIQALGRRHADYGVTDKHYEVVGAALLWTLHQGLGAQFTAPVKEAWAQTYFTVSTVMKKAAAEAFAEAA
jgi:hemoglobin-like flavoprotein